MERKFDTCIAAKGVKEEEVEFKFKGNRLQFQHNNAVLGKLNDGLQAAYRGDGDTCATNIKAAIREIQTRNKHIRIADTSDAGWNAVAEYVGSNIEEDSDGEKSRRRS